MDHLEVVLDIVDENVFMSSIDLKDAYYSVPIWQNHKKFLVFQWEQDFFQFNVLPFGLTSAPRVFTKILKPVFSQMRKEGFSVLGYIDDSLILGKLQEECELATTRLIEILSDLGFTINQQKSVFSPSNQITFLGYVIDSKNMTVCPTDKKREKAVKTANKLLEGSRFKIRFVASAIGFIVDLCKGIEYGANHFRYLERDKILALRKAGSKGYEGSMFLSNDARKELKWWRKNVKFRSKKIRVNQPTLLIKTDASNQGWGAVFDEERTGGRWSQNEIIDHINVLELRAILLGLQSFFKDYSNVDILVKSDNTTAVAYVNNMGGSKSMQCEKIAKQIWSFCEDRELWLVAAHIPGEENVEADFVSRNFTDNTEWALNTHIFQKIVDTWGSPEIDMFASRLNNKVQTYVSWLKDPNAIEVNAFTVDWDKWKLIYAFPPFSLISKCVRRIRRTTANVIMIVPDWPGQVWYASLRKPFIRDSMKFPPREGNLVPQKGSLLGSKMTKVPLLAVLY